MTDPPKSKFIALLPLLAGSVFPVLRAEGTDNKKKPSNRTRYIIMVIYDKYKFATTRKEETRHSLIKKKTCIYMVLTMKEVVLGIDSLTTLSRNKLSFT